MRHETLEPGTLLGRFRIEALAGHGGMGDVYQAYDTALERQVALKRLRVNVQDSVALARFHREAQSLAQLNHPCVCQVYDFTETEAGLFIAMEWVEGDTLPDLMGWPRKPLPPKEVQSIVRGIAEALAAAHAKGIIHRDLKPSNVMVAKGGVVKVLDFGLAKSSAEEPESHETPAMTDPAKQFLAAARGELVVPPDPVSTGSGAWDPLTQAGFFMGTPGYASPEQARGRAVTPASDVFGLGILTHELLTGKRPFPGEGEAQLRAVVLNDRLSLPHPNGARRLWNLMERMLAPKPEHRPSAAEVAEAIAALERPVGASWWTAAAALSTVVVVSGFWWLRGRGIIADLTRERPARVAILRIRNQTGDPRLDAVVQAGLPELLAGALRESPRLSVIEPDALIAAAGRLKLDPQGAAEGDLARLGAALGASLQLTGEVIRDPGHQQDRLHFKLTDQRGRVRFDDSVSQPIRPTFLPQALLYPAVEELLKAVDPWHGGETLHAKPRIPEQLFTSYSEGVNLLARGEYGKAEPLLAQAAFGAPDFAPGVGAYATCLRFQGKDKTGPTSFWAVYAARQAGDRYAEAFGQNALASWALQSHDLDRAEGAYRQALALAETNKDFDRQCTALNGLGLVAQSRGDMSAADTQYHKSLALAQKAGDHIMESQILANLANLALGSGNLSEAEKLYRQALAIAEEIGSRESEALALNNLGVVLLTMLKVEEAKAPLLKSLEIRQATHSVAAELNSQRNLGIYHLMRGEFDQADSRFRLSLNLALETKGAYGTAKALFYLGETQLQQGHFELARPSLEEAATLFQTLSSPVPRAECLAGAALCLVRAKGQPTPEAERLMFEAIAAAPSDPFVLRGQAWLAAVSGRRQEALDLLDRAILDPSHTGPEIQLDLAKARQHLSHP
ncbi:MAG TPA: serine/threonine-protein kinase [Holophagaceae bacterium]|nr:serine/threonine-protein kinase [Holophagaceae bacterium]